MKKISIYVRNKNYTPSSYYRIIQYTDELEGQFKLNINQIATDFIYIKILYSKNKNIFLWKLAYYFIMQVNLTNCLINDIFFFKPDKIFVSKSFSPKYTMLLNKILLYILLWKKELIWDFDDDIINTKEISYFQKKIIFKFVKVIIVTQKNLVLTLPKDLRKKVITLPTTDKMLINSDFDNVTKKRKTILQSGQLNIVWVGTSYNLPNLELICSDLDTAARNLIKQNIKVNFFVICNQDFQYDFEYVNLKNISWKRDIVKEIFEICHIGLMPLVDNQYNRGKGGFKLIQYLSSGIVTFGSDVGMNRDIIDNETGFISNDSWANKIVEIGSSPNYWESVSKKALLRFEAKFSYKDNLDKINKIFKE